MIVKINIFRGDLSDISAKTATLVLFPLPCSSSNYARHYEYNECLHITRLYMSSIALPSRMLSPLTRVCLKYTLDYTALGKKKQFLNPNITMHIIHGDQTGIVVYFNMKKYNNVPHVRVTHRYFQPSV